MIDSETTHTQHAHTHTGVDSLTIKRLLEHGLRQACISAECSAIHQTHKSVTGTKPQPMLAYGWENIRPKGGWDVNNRIWHTWSTQGKIGERSLRDGHFLPFLFGCPECGPLPEDTI